MAMELFDQVRTDLGQCNVEAALDVIGVDHVHHNHPSASSPLRWAALIDPRLLQMANKA
jgi:hypothetical protein